jgi:hypothetical protein
MKSIVFAVIALVSTAAVADAPKKGFWKILVKPDAKWTLYRKGEKDKKKAPRIVIETHDVRKVGAADVARLRWTLVAADGKKSAYQCDGCYTQIAVTSAGMYIVSDAKDDAQIAASLKGKPSRSDPPKSYGGTKQNAGRFLNLHDSARGKLACYGERPSTGEAEACEEPVCYGLACVSADLGIVRLDGFYAPDPEGYAADGFEDDQ